MELKLNVYKQGNNREIEKTYTTDTYDLMYGTLEDLIYAIDPEMLKGKGGVNGIDNAQLGSLVITLLPKIKPLLRDMFVGLTDDEIKRTKVKELIPVFVGAFTYAFNEIKGIEDTDSAGN